MVTFYGLTTHSFKFLNKMLTAEKFYLFQEGKCFISEHIVSKLNIQSKFHGNFKELAASNINLNID